MLYYLKKKIYLKIKIILKNYKIRNTLIKKIIHSILKIKKPNLETIK